MTDLYVYDLGEGRTAHVRVHTPDKGPTDVRLVVKDGSNQIVSPPLPDVQLGVLASYFAGLYFERTKRVVWPVEGAMLHAYEKEQTISENRRLEWLKTSPNRENRERAGAAPTLDVRAQAEAPPTEADNAPPAPPARRRVM